MEAILIPVKSLDQSKLRLAAILGPEQRRRLALSLLADVLQAAAGWPLRLLVSGDGEVAAVARAAGWVVVADPGSGLNAALEAATRQSVVLGADALLVLPCDVPLATPEELRSLFALEAQVVVSRSDDGGTTGLLRRPPAAIGPRFGPGSAGAHVAAAQSAGLPVISLQLPGLALDVDNPEDLQQLARSAQERGSVQLARELLAEAAGLSQEGWPETVG